MIYPRPQLRQHTHTSPKYSRICSNSFNRYSRSRARSPHVRQPGASSLPDSTTNSPSGLQGATGPTTPAWCRSPVPHTAAPIFMSGMYFSLLSTICDCAGLPGICQIGTLSFRQGNERVRSCVESRSLLSPQSRWRRPLSRKLIHRWIVAPIPATRHVQHLVVHHRLPISHRCIITTMSTCRRHRCRHSCRAGLLHKRFHL